MRYVKIWNYRDRKFLFNCDLTNFYFCIAVAICIYFFALIFGFVVGVGAHTDAFGMIDLRYYLSALSLIVEAQNPYDVTLLNERAMQLNLDPNILSVYPPWTYALLLPLSVFPPPCASLLWFAFNISLIYCVSQVTWQLILDSSSIAKSQNLTMRLIVNHCLPFFVALIYPPVCVSLNMGQLSIFVTFMIIICIWATINKKPAIAGISLALAMVKPTTSILFGVGVVCWVLSCSVRNRVKFFISAGTTILVLTLVVEIVCPGIVLWWKEQQGRISEYAILSKHSVLGDVVQQVIYDMTSQFHVWPFFLFPIIGVFVVIKIWISRRSDNLIRFWIPVLCLCCIFAPSAFIADHSVTVITQVAIFAMACQRHVTEQMRDRVILLLSAYVCGMFAMMSIVNDYVYWIAYAPVLMLCWFIVLYWTQKLR